MQSSVNCEAILSESGPLKRTIIRAAAPTALLMAQMVSPLCTPRSSPVGTLGLFLLHRFDFLHLSRDPARQSGPGLLGFCIVRLAPPGRRGVDDHLARLLRLFALFDVIADALAFDDADARA